MEFEELLSKSKWSILKELAKGDKSAIDIAKKTGQSIANTSQQIKLLEAYNIIKKNKQENEKPEKERKAGKPKTPYCLNQELLLIAFLKQGEAEKKIIKIKELDEFHKTLLNILTLLEPEEHYCLIKFLCETEMLRKADTLAYLKSDEKEIELFIITEHSLAEIREKYSNSNIPCLSNKTKKIISWSHNKKEIEEGLDKKEEYFVNLVKNSKELLDKKDNLKELKQKL